MIEDDRDRVNSACYALGQLGFLVAHPEAPNRERSLAQAVADLQVALQGDAAAREQLEARREAVAKQLMGPRPDRVVVDPDECGCTDCLTGYSTPAGYLSADQLATIRAGHVEDRSSGHLADRLNREAGDPRG